MIYLGIDPSFTKTGAVYIDTEERTIKFVCVSPPGSNVNYKMMINRSAFISIELIEHLCLNKDTKLVIEEPLVRSLKASTLGILSATTAWAFVSIASVKEMYSINPSYVNSLHTVLAKQLNLGKKQTSKYVAGEIVKYFEESKGYKVIVHNDKKLRDGTMKKRVLSHDEAEAFILALTLMRLDNSLSTEDLGAIYTINPKFARVVSLNRFK